MSGRHQEGLAHLVYGINQGGGFVALTGEVGTGKTTLCQCLLQQLPHEVDIALILNPKLNTEDLLATICDELGIDHAGQGSNLKSCVDALNRYLLRSHGQGRRTVLMIDEAQNLSLDVLEQIRLLTNLETSKQKLLQIVLVGQPELMQLLKSPELRQLNQRITARYHLLPLNERETGEYIRHRLRVGHGAEDIFNAAAVRRVFQLSGGIPRLINIICDRALLGAYVSDRRKVNVAMINQAANEIDPALKNRPQKVWSMILSLMVLCLGIGGYYAYRVADKEMQLAEDTVTVEANTVEPEPPVASVAETDVPEAVETATAELNHLTDLSPDDATLTAAFSALLARWKLPDAAPDACDQLPLNCLAGQGRWSELIALQRPAIMEFKAADGSPFHLLLIAVRQGVPVFWHDQQEWRIALHEVLNAWRGYYLLLWEAPVDGATVAYPGSRSALVSWLRARLEPDKAANGSDAVYLDDALTEAVRRFQQREELVVDGVAGPLTLIKLQNLEPAGYGPRLEISD